MKPKRNPPGEGLPDDLRRRLNAARDAMLRLHKTLLDHERARYERQHGPFPNNVAFLQAVLNDAFFAWLRPVSEMIVQIDEIESDNDVAATKDAEALLTQAIDLLRPEELGEGFQREYHRALQASPDVAGAHATWRRATAKP